MKVEFPQVDVGKTPQKLDEQLLSFWEHILVLQVVVNTSDFRRIS